MTPADHAIQTLFVANRGEIARRIATTAVRLGIRAVVPDLDGPSAVDLLSSSAVAEAARAAGADAVHPGYGFLAEDPALARAVLDAGLTWVGPPPEAIRALGDKAEARAIARHAGVPVADGEEPEDQSDASLRAAADRIRFPVLVKPVAGGGGKGIRVVDGRDDLPAALASARREAARAFAEDRLLVERYVPDARHVEVQVLADRHGAVVHLGDRDCSLQRRHQKVIEEAPAPGLDENVRRALRDAAVRLATVVGYESAGTCEFLVGGDGTWVFLELNARLQVEHPVTELILGRDLVADQLAIAGGATLEQLGLEQGGIALSLENGGHAIEARLNAEDPANGFLPSAGRVLAVRWPNGATSFGPVGAASTRVDAAIDPGDVVGGRFDPLLAKVIATGPDRATALSRLADALDATEVLGLPTNLAFLRRLVRLPVLAEGRARTTTIETDPAAAQAASSDADPPVEAWQAAAQLLVASDPGAWRGGWRLNARPTVAIAADSGDGPVVRAVELRPDVASTQLQVLDGRTVFASVDGRSVAFALAAAPDLAAADERAATSGPSAGEATLQAPMPGIVVAVHVRAGDVVKTGDRVATLEAMKMEHVVTAPRHGRIEEVGVREGEQVERGRVVARLGAAS